MPWDHIANLDVLVLEEMSLKDTRFGGEITLEIHLEKL